jgi:hypothetical protein
MRVESFAKDAATLATSARTLVGMGATGFNVPQKSKAESCVAQQRTSAATPTRDVARPAANLFCDP